MDFESDGSRHVHHSLAKEPVGHNGDLVSSRERARQAGFDGGGAGAEEQEHVGLGLEEATERAGQPPVELSPICAVMGTHGP